MDFPQLGLEDNFWLAGTDVGNQSNFYWMGHGERLTFTDWAAGQPDKLQSNQNCLKMKHSPFNGLNEWHNDRCVAEYYFICEESE